jgi:lipopolysaccharide export system protein LptA
VLSGEDSNRAFFRQKREGLNEFMEGEAQSIEYDGRADQVRFRQRAELRRLRGTVVSDEIVGQSITYNNLTEVFTVDGRVEGSKTTPALGVKPDGSRVRAVLSPRTDNGVKK